MSVFVEKVFQTLDSFNCLFLSLFQPDDILRAVVLPDTVHSFLGVVVGGIISQNRSVKRNIYEKDFNKLPNFRR